MLFALQVPLLKARREVALLRYVFAQDAEIAFVCFAEGDTAAGNPMEGRRAARSTDRRRPNHREKISEENAISMDCDWMEISAHASHPQWQGKIVSLSGRKGYLSKRDIGYGTGPGFKGWNCRHD